MRCWPAILALGLLACSQAPTSMPVAKVSPTASAATPSTVPSSAPSSAPTPIQAIPDLPVSAVGFSCRLPVYQAEGGIADEFLSFPGTTLTVDPSGHNGRYFDVAYSRWVPAPRGAVSPDGAHYASIDYTGSDFVLHLIAVVGGKDAPIHLPPQAFNGQPEVLDYSADGIYLDNAFEHLLAGLWLVNPSTGQMRQVSKDIYPVLSAGNGIVWTQAVNPADVNPVVTRSSAGTLPDEIDRVDLRSGARTQWLYEPGKGLGIIGLDSRGSPLIVDTTVWGADPNARLLLVAHAGSPTPIYKGAIVQEIGGGITDLHGTWLSGQAGIYLYTNSGALLKVSDHPAYAYLANGCI
ncbi:MAG TPA: hypothetical protein VJR46_00740 [Candidatus Dormibacteraeota bacterium]|nr:hypothetical protein [Candidatus Dormibacteraeota bacterium]